MTSVTPVAAASFTPVAAVKAVARRSRTKEASDKRDDLSSDEQSAATTDAAAPPHTPTVAASSSAATSLSPALQALLSSLPLGGL